MQPLIKLKKNVKLMMITNLVRKVVLKEDEEGQLKEDVQVKEGVQVKGEVTGENK